MPYNYCTPYWSIFFFQILLTFYYVSVKNDLINVYFCADQGCFENCSDLLWEQIVLFSDQEYFFSERQASKICCNHYLEQFMTGQNNV